MVYCTACGDTNWADQRYCPTCGRDLHPERATSPEPFADQPLPDQVGYDEQPGIDVPAPDPAPAPVRSGWRRWRWPAAAIAGLLVVAGGTAAAVWPRDATPAAAQSDPAVMSVDLGTHPRLAWKHSLAEWAQQCSATDVNSSDYCPAETVAVSEKYMVVQLKPPTGFDQLLGVDLKTGAVAWRHELPGGTVSTCRSSDNNLWCIAVTGSLQPSPTDDGDVQPVEIAGPAQLLAIDTDTGSSKGAAVLGASGLHDFLAIGPDFVLVSSQSSDASPDSQGGQIATTVPMDVRRFDASPDGGWQRTLPKGLSNASLGTPILQANGVDYVGYLSDAKDQGIGFDQADGSVKKLTGGAAIGIHRGRLVTVRGQSQYAIDGHVLPGEGVLPVAHDDSPDIPLITTANNEANGDGSQLRQSDPPYKLTHTVPGLARAFCGGRLFTESATQPATESPDASGDTPDNQTVTLRAIDPKTGHVDWQSEMPADGFVICSGANIAVSRAGSVTGIAISSGKKEWSVAIPDQMMFGGWTKSGIFLEGYVDTAAHSFAYLSR